jgi:hypothetical protein
MHRRKPRGKQGHIELAPRARATYHLAQLPETKEELESYIVDKTLRSAARDMVAVYRRSGDPFRTTENDFDFALPTAEGIQFIELMEFAPLHLFGNSYDNAPLSYVQGPMADVFVDMIKTKARKYGKRSVVGLHLLTYCTDARFEISDDVVDLVAWSCQQQVRPFASIAYLVPRRDNDKLYMIFPRAAEAFADFNAQVLRSKAVIRPDLARMTSPKDGSVEAPLAWPPWRGPTKLASRRPKRRR